MYLSSMQTSRLLAVFDDMDTIPLLSLAVKMMTSNSLIQFIVSVEDAGAILGLMEPDLLELLVLVVEVDAPSETKLLDVPHLDPVVVDTVDERFVHENHDERCPVVEGTVTFPILGDHVPAVTEQLEEHVQLGHNEGAGILELEHPAHHG